MKMLIVLLVSCVGCFAKLGETEKEIEARYGSAVNKSKGGKLYSFDKFNVAVVFQQGVSSAELLRGKEPKTEISDSDAVALGEAISGTNGFSKENISSVMQTAWKNPNGCGILKTHDFVKGDELMVVSARYMATVEAESNLKKKEMVSKFSAPVSVALQPDAKEIEKQAKADREFQRGIAEKNAEAQKHIEVVAAEKTKAISDRAVAWNLSKANSGDAYGQFRMGERYRDGEGVVKDETKAKEWLKKAADQGHKEAVSALAWLTSHPSGAASASRPPQ